MAIPAGTRSKPWMLPTSAPARRGPHRSSLVSLSVVQPLRAGLTFGWHKVFQVFVPGRSARETNLQIFG
jgi:hypothetical protein